MHFFVISPKFIQLVIILKPTMSHIRSLEQCLMDDEDAIAEHFASPCASSPV